MITDHLEIIRLNQVIESLKSENKKLLTDKEKLQKQFDLHVVDCSLPKNKKKKNKKTIWDTKTDIIERQLRR